MKDVAKILLELNAITLNPKKPFRYASGIISPVYTDCRVLMAYPKERKKIRDFYIEAIKKSKLDFDVVAGTATAGIPHASWIADKLDLPMVYVRGKAKDHGKENLMEGIIKKNQKAIVIEDLVSTAQSALNSVNAVRMAGGQISHVFCIITYGMDKAKKVFEENKLNLISLTTFSEIIELAKEMGYIESDEIKIILDWIKDPTGWAKKNNFE
jgi:orotate phosphoribosyltransferase